MSESSVERKYAGLTQAALCLFVFACTFVYCFEFLWGSYTKAGYALSGFASAAVLVFCFFKGKLYERMDAWALVIFLYWTVLSAFANYGLNLRMLASRSICVWVFVISLYFVMLASEKPDGIMKGFSRVMVFGLTLSIAYILFNATKTLLDKIPQSYELKGCFQAGRLYGYGNANVAGFACTALAMAALYRWLDTDKKAGKRLYAAAFVFGCFCLGLTNCRTCIIGVSFFAGLIVYAAVLRIVSSKIKAPALVKQLVAIFSAAACVLAMVGLFYLPTPVYKGALKLYSSLFGKAHVSGNSGGITSRAIASDNATVVERTWIWKRVVHDTFTKPKLALFGISGVSNENIHGIYPGYYEIPVNHAHNSFLEVLRRYGMPGLILVLSVTVYCCIKGIGIYFDKEKKLSDVCLVSAAASMLLMGMAEQISFPSTAACFLNPLFFVICGYCVGKRRGKCQRVK